MDSVYRFMLNNKAFDDIIENLINKRYVAIIKKNEELNDIINYFSDFIINEFDKKSLSKIINEIIQDDNNEKLDIKKMTVLRRQINNNAENIIKIFSTFINKDSINYSLNDLYSITNKSIEFKDKEFEYYSILSKSPIILEGNSSEIIKEVNYIMKNNYVNKFLKYKKFKNNKKFDIIKDDINKNDINKVIKKLSGILNNNFAFIPPIYFNEYTSDFENERIYYENYSNDKIKDIVKNINYKHNKETLNEAESLKWYKHLGIKSYKEMLARKKELYDHYKEEEILICNQYIENIEYLQMFLGSFSFVNKVYKGEVLEEINKRIINEEELYNYIYYIKETLIIYKNYLVLKSNIEMLNETSMEFLDYIYEKLTDKKDLNSILEFIPNYYYYKKIESMEDNNIDIINSYNKVYEKIIKLNEALKSYNKILLKGLRENCNMEIKRFSIENNIKINELDINKLTYERYFQKNIKFLLKMFPIIVLDEKEYLEYKDNIDEVFDLVVKQSDLIEMSGRSYEKENDICNEKLDRSIFKMLNNLGYTTFQKEDDISIIYVDFEKAKNKVIYINNKDIFDYEELIKIIDLINLGCEIIFIWYRNWWINKNEEVQKIHKLLNE
ncbi:hypothetical protein [uncultured Clostridium sp.]|uniref:hypothetical protein n=1 Tax=uncultured Clostridium sp. TaxID=59620 RepID=UPI0025D377D7|nr:hypothetical protein [uncultured Clostridium sp.]MDU4882240.1 hypothetical protein [Clostridium celatum]MDU7075510.1 hypothetical protein [Clostridium celatum]